MADREWQGVTSTWTTASNWSGATAPVDTDSVFFTGASNQSVDGLTLGAGANDFVDWTVHELYSGLIGTSGAPIVCGTQTKIMFGSRSGRLHVDSGANAITTFKYVAQNSNSLAVQLDGTVTTLKIENASGGIRIVGGAALTTVEMTNSPGCMLTIEASVTALDLITLSGGGTIDCSSLIDAGANSRVIINGGHFIHRIGVINRLEMYGEAHPSIFEHLAAAEVQAGFLSGPGVTFEGRQNRSVTVAASVFTAKNRARVYVDNGMDSYAASTITTDGTAQIDGGTGVVVTYT